MKLLTKKLIQDFEKVGEQRNTKDPTVIAKFFNPCGSSTWYATAYYPNENICFGYVTGLQYDEWGYFSIDELESLRVPPFGLSIERDVHFEQQPFSQLNLTS